MEYYVIVSFMAMCILTEKENFSPTAQTKNKAQKSNHYIIRAQKYYSICSIHLSVRVSGSSRCNSFLSMDSMDSLKISYNHQSHGYLRQVSCIF